MHKKLVTITACVLTYTSSYGMINLKLLTKVDPQGRPLYADTDKNHYCLCKSTGTDLNSPATNGHFEPEEYQTLDTLLNLKECETLTIGDEQIIFYKDIATKNFFRIFKFNVPDTQGNKYALIKYPKNTFIPEKKWQSSECKSDLKFK